MQRGGRLQVGPLADHELAEALAQLLPELDLLLELFRDQHGLEEDRRAHRAVGRPRSHAILGHQTEGGGAGEILGGAAPLAADGRAAVGAPLRQGRAGILRTGAAEDLLEHDTVESVVVGGLEGDPGPSSRRQRGTCGRRRHADVGRTVREQHQGERLVQAAPAGGVVGRQPARGIRIGHQAPTPLTVVRRRFQRDRRILAGHEHDAFRRAVEGQHERHRGMHGDFRPLVQGLHRARRQARVGRRLHGDGEPLDGQRRHRRQRVARGWPGIAGGEAVGDGHGQPGDSVDESLFGAGRLEGPEPDDAARVVGREELQRDGLSGASAGAQEQLDRFALDGRGLAGLDGGDGGEGGRGQAAEGIGDALQRHGPRRAVAQAGQHEHQQGGRQRAGAEAAPAAVLELGQRQDCPVGTGLAEIGAQPRGVAVRGGREEHAVDQVVVQLRELAFQQGRDGGGGAAAAQDPGEEHQGRDRGREEKTGERQASRMARTQPEVGQREPGPAGQHRGRAEEPGLEGAPAVDLAAEAVESFLKRGHVVCGVRVLSRYFPLVLRTWPGSTGPVSSILTSSRNSSPATPPIPTR